MEVLHGKQVVVVSDEKKSGSDSGIEPAMPVTEAGKGIFVYLVPEALGALCCIQGSDKEDLF
jgi:hypothetical protein